MWRRAITPASQLPSLEIPSLSYSSSPHPRFLPQPPFRLLPVRLSHFRLSLACPRQLPQTLRRPRRFKANPTKPCTIHVLQSYELVACRFSFPRLVYGRMFSQVCHRMLASDNRCICIYLAKKGAHTASDARVTSASSPPIWVQLGSPKPRCSRLCACSQWGRDCSNFCRPEGVSRRSLCRRSTPVFTPIHPRFVRGLSMRVKLVVSNASNLPKFP
jgi:hypothetical protein